MPFNTRARLHARTHSSAYKQVMSYLAEPKFLKEASKDP